jgi:hypothetical protein
MSIGKHVVGPSFSPGMVKLAANCKLWRELAPRDHVAGEEKIYDRAKVSFHGLRLPTLGFSGPFFAQPSQQYHTRASILFPPYQASKVPVARPRY